MNPPFSIVLLLLLSLLLSCGSGDWLVEQDFGEDSSWGEKEALSFSYDNPIEGRKQLILDFAFSAEYPYQNIWVKLEITDPKGEESALIFGDTLMDVAGLWIGMQDIGSTVDWQIDPQPTLELSQSGKYEFRLLQYMREEKLEGIQSLRVRLND